MTVGINDIAIKLSVHAEGVSAGFRTAAEEARGFQKEIDRFAYAVDKGLNRNFGPVLDAALNAQFTKDTEERIAREKKAQEDFNAWYRKEMEQEVAAYTAAEAAKEEATKSRIAAERQAALYMHNMQQIITARPLPTETEARGQELLNLEQAIRARFALMDQEQQRIQNQIAMNTTNAQRFQAVLEMETAARAKANNDLRQHIQQKYALLAEEERSERLNADNSAEIQRIKAMKVKQIADQAVAQKAADFAAYKAQLAQEEAASIQNAERMSQLAQNNAANILEIQRLSGAKAAAARELELNDLRAAITARYALLDEEAQLTQNNAANTAELQRLATSQADAAHETELTQLREYIIQKYTALAEADAQEQRQLEMNRVNANRSRERAMADAEEDRERELRQLREAITARYALEDEADRFAPQQQSHVDAFRTNQLREQANAQAEANRIMQQNLTLNERYARQLANLNRLNTTVITTTGRVALSTRDFTRAKTALTIATIRHQQAQTGANAAMAAHARGYGGTAMAMGQLSYAAEDFIQVLSMGGGLNMALMSASNNLSMVARALLGTSGMMSAVAGFAIPALLIGTGILIQYLLREEDQIDAVTRAYKRLHDELEHTQDLLNRQMQHRFNMQDIDDLTTYAAALAKLRQEIRDLAEAEAEAAALEEKIAATRKEIRDTVAGGTIIADAQKVVDMMMQMQGVHDAAQIAAAKNDVRQLTEAYAELADAMATGTPDEIVRAAEEMKRVIDGTSEVFKLEFLNGDQAAKLAAILGTEDETAKLEALRELMQELALMNGDMANGADAVNKAQEATNRLLRQENQLRQDNIRFQLEATDAQKEAIDLQNQLAQFLGVDNPNPMQGLDPNDMSAEQARQSAEFLELMWRNLDRQKKEILEEKQRVTPVGGLEQNTYQAQADAFKQVLEATNREEDPQLTRLIRLQETANDLLEDITGIRIVQ
jgi:hypothetical protein